MSNAATATKYDLSRYYLPVPETAKILGVSPFTIWRWIHAEKIPYILVGRRTYLIPKKYVLPEKYFPEMHPKPKKQCAKCDCNK